MEKQQSIADIEYANRKRKTKRDEFLEIMEEVIPWDEWTVLVEPNYPGGKRGRPPRGVETMLRMYLLANWFNLSDEGVEDAIYDSYAFRKFMRERNRYRTLRPCASSGSCWATMESRSCFSKRYGRFWIGTAS